MGAVQVRSTTGKSAGSLHIEVQGKSDAPVKIKLDRNVGSGLNGEVLLAHTPEGDELVMKVGRRSDPEKKRTRLARDLKKELQLSKKLHAVHPAVVRHRAGIGARSAGPRVLVALHTGDA